MNNKILIVDDDDTTLVILSQIARRMGCEYVTASNGQAALKLLQEGEFAMVLLDVLMPGMSGIDVLKKIRQSYERAELPVVIVTGNDTDKDLVKALGAGANDFLTKPVNVEISLARIRSQLELAKFYRHSLKLIQLETLQAMITTYNHEINNPLASGLGFLEMAMAESNSDKLVKAHKSLVKIQKVVLKIRDVGEHELEYSDYACGGKLLKVAD